MRGSNQNEVNVWLQKSQSAAPWAMQMRLRGANPWLTFVSRQSSALQPCMVGSGPHTAWTMFSHIVIFWTDPAQPKAADELIQGAERYLKHIPGMLHFHVGRMVSSARPVVDQTYQVALNTGFASKQAQDDYQVHPQHLEFVEKVFNRVCTRAVIYDFE
jgi:hypothetical protein